VSEYVKSQRTVGRPDRVLSESYESGVRQGLARSMSDAQIARSIGCSSRTVTRIRKRLGLAPTYRGSGYGG
jgi:hypothetical protein